MKEVNWEFNIGDEIKDDKRELIIIDRVFIKKGDIQPNNLLAENNCRWYKYKCLKCGNEHWITWRNIRKRGCNACCVSHKKVLLGVNTIWDKAKWMVDLGVSEEDAKKYFPTSKEKVKVICPICGKSKLIPLYNIYNARSINCVCGDGVSYPEKFMFSLLTQLNINFEIHKTFEWSNRKEYDFYLYDFNAIIEMNGGQHYRETSRGRNLEEEQENDKYKMELALKNNIDKYIIIDSRYSDNDWIKNNILISELNDILNLKKVDWNTCNTFALGNLIKTACDYKNNNNNITSREIGEILGYNENTIRVWLKKGAKLGWCLYDPKLEMIKNGSKNGEKSGKKVEVFKDGKSYGVFDSVKKLIEKSYELFGVQFNNVYQVCNGKRKSCHGYTFKYVE